MPCHTAYNCNALDTCNFSIISYHAFYFDCLTIQKVVGFTSQQYLLSNTVGNAAIDFTTDSLLINLHGGVQNGILKCSISLMTCMYFDYIILRNINII